MAKMRLDKWLWCSRFFRTRTLAQKAIEKGHVMVNDQYPKTSREIAIGDRLFVRQAHQASTVTVTALSERRGSATEVQQWFTESADSRALREAEQARRQAARLSEPSYGSRPDKHERRQRLDLQVKTV